jgi:hypothetical protein
MKITMKILLVIIFIICLITTYWISARYTDFIFDDLLEKGKWGNVNPISTLLTGILSLMILLTSLIYYKPIFKVIKLSKTIKIGFLISLFFILIATFFWADSWAKDPIDIAESRELGDTIWKLGHPLTFIIIDLPIYLRLRFENFKYYLSDLWLYPSIVILFIVQFCVYIHGLRMIINLKKIITANG